MSNFCYALQIKHRRTRYQNGCFWGCNIRFSCENNTCFLIQPFSHSFCFSTFPKVRVLGPPWWIYCFNNTIHKTIHFRHSTLTPVSVFLVMPAPFTAVSCVRLRESCHLFQRYSNYIRGCFAGLLMYDIIRCGPSDDAILLPFVTVDLG